MNAEYRDKHLAELHAVAAEQGVTGYRKLRREELIDRISGSTEAGAEAPKAAGERPDGGSGRTRSRRGRGRSPQRDSREEHPESTERDERPEPEAPEVEVTGVLDVMPDGFGFLRLKGIEPSEGDVYVSPSQIRRCELRSGDVVSGGERRARRGERHPALVRVESVNGGDPEGERTRFEDMTPIEPGRRLDLGGASTGARAVDLLAPVALGQRVLVASEPRAGQTTLLRELAAAIASTDPGPALLVALADERPEEVIRWRRELPDVEIVAAAADRTPQAQAQLAELALARAKRRVEAGEDVVLIVDSLSRLALGYRDPARVKLLFGAARELEEEGAGSLTIIASVVLASGAPAADSVYEALASTENALVRLSSALAVTGLFPALAVTASGASGEEMLRGEEEMAAVRRLRGELADLSPADAARRVLDLLAESESNSELLARL